MLKSQPNIPSLTFWVTVNVFPVSNGTVQLTGSGDRIIICSGDLTRVGSGGDLTICSMTSWTGSGLALDIDVPPSLSVSSSSKFWCVWHCFCVFVYIYLWQANCAIICDFFFFFDYEK